MIVLFTIALLSAFLTLVLASQLPAPAWLAALNATAFSAATAIFAALGAVLDRVQLPQRLRPLALPAVTAVAAFGLRRWLLDWLAPPEAVPRIDYFRLQLAALSLVAALFALLGGAAALSRAGPWPHLAAAGASVTLAMYVAGPVLLRAGVPLDVRAFLGLAGLGVGAYAIVEGARRVGGGKRR